MTIFILGFIFIPHTKRKPKPYTSANECLLLLYILKGGDDEQVGVGIWVMFWNHCSFNDYSDSSQCILLLYWNLVIFGDIWTNNITTNQRNIQHNLKKKSYISRCEIALVQKSWLYCGVKCDANIPVFACIDTCACIIYVLCDLLFYLYFDVAFICQNSHETNYYSKNMTQTPTKCGGCSLILSPDSQNIIKYMA